MVRLNIFHIYLVGPYLTSQNDQQWSKMADEPPSYSSDDVSRDGKEGTA